jgi:predicted NAD/FAD-dependent oxidoreductase
MSQSDAPRIAVIGAGMAGLACAGALHNAGADVTLFDKSRRVGGRLATRRVGDLIFDHGAQYATSRDPAFVAEMQAMAATGDAAPWPAAGDGRWCGVPGMSALARHMQRQGVGAVRTARHAAFLHRQADGWMVRHMDAATTPPGLVSDTGGELAGPFDRVAVAIPAPQAKGLLHTHDFAHTAARAGMAPCWAMMLAFPAAAAAPDVLRLDTGPLRWIARDSSRPGRTALPECWIAHAAPEWSRGQLEQPAEAVLAALLDAFTTATEIRSAPSYAAVHRWRYALADVPLGVPALWDAASGLGVCGDWCLGARVEAAFLSGRTLAGMMLG